ncbi:MAG: hypothetical protein KDA17_08280 [Candidatus Saccharibacteria bacterium]|nr:hypothetical protein [Candidatus Saccharibacteria bacterium]
MGGGVLASLFKKADDSIYKGLQSLASKPNGIGMSTPTFKAKAKQRLLNIDSQFVNPDLGELMGRNNLKINNVGGLGNTPMLQEAYELLTRRK